MTKIPAAALQQHIGVLGKTGSGKTSTGKLIVEQVVRDSDARVCILDTVKSDWWGLTSSADGQRPGLPFHILGGPRGHVPLHAGAGRAIAELVASGALRQSIIDMADFEAGGVQRFFVDFAPALIRNMRGVLYLVMEEAHELAPKERAGFGAENMAIHFAKKLATAGRSKGIRLVVLTQRTQSLHNALLGSCETMIAHRFTAPADQEPVVKWLKANLDPARAKEIAGSLSSLKTGEGWLCAGEANLLERRQFPRIATYDNSATPADDDHAHEVKTAPVDKDRLRAIIGDAVVEAEASDPKVLRARIAELERQGGKAKAPAVDVAAIARARAEGLQEGLAKASALVDDIERGMRLGLDRIESARLALGNAAAVEPVATSARPLAPVKAKEIRAEPPVSESRGEIGGGAKRRVMIAMAQNPDGIAARKLAILADVTRGGSTWRGIMAALRKDQHVTDNGETFTITAAGLSALGAYEPLPAGRELREHWRRKMGAGSRLAVFDAILAAYPGRITPEAVARQAGVELGGSTWRGHMANLRGLELVSGRDELRASEDLFQ